MNLYYTVNNTTITLQICHFEEVSQRPVYSEDGSDYLYTHFQISVVCTWNPQATAGFNDTPNPPPDGQPGDWAAVSIANLRQLLLQPRGDLTIKVGPYTLLDVPGIFFPASLGGGAAAATVDCLNGPRPIACDVTSFHGIKTAIVRYRIECYFSECNDPPSSLISNRWTMEEDIREDYLSTLTVTGTAVFRQDILQVMALRPDNLRPLFIAPPKVGFQRMGLRVSLVSSTQIAYTYRDEECPGNYQFRPDGGIIRAVGNTWGRVDWSQAFSQFTPRFWKVKLPEAQTGMHIEVWGRFNTSRRALANALVRIAASASLPTNRRLNIRSYVQIDFPHRHGVLDATVTGSGLTGGIWNLFTANNLQDMANCFFDFDAPPIWVQGQAPLANIAPGGDGRHGDALSLQLIAQALLTPCQMPPTPKAPISVQPSP